MDSETLRALAAREREDDARARQSYADLVAAVRQASAEGMQQADIGRDTGRSRKRIGQMCDPGYRPAGPAVLAGEKPRTGNLGAPPKMTPEKEAEMESLFAAGLKPREVADALGVHRNTVYVHRRARMQETAGQSPP